MRDRIDIGEQVVEGPAVHVVLEQGRVLVLDPQVLGVEPGAVVGAVAGDERQGAGVAGLVGERFPRPALVYRLKQVQPKPGLVRPEDVGTAVVHVHEAKAGVAALVVHDAGARRQCER